MTFHNLEDVDGPVSVMDVVRATVAANHHEVATSLHDVWLPDSELGTSVHGEQCHHFDGRRPTPTVAMAVDPNEPTRVCHRCGGGRVTLTGDARIQAWLLGAVCDGWPAHMNRRELARRWDAVRCRTDVGGDRGGHATFVDTLNRRTGLVSLGVDIGRTITRGSGGPLHYFAPDVPFGSPEFGRPLALLRSFLRHHVDAIHGLLADDIDAAFELADGDWHTWTWLRDLATELTGCHPATRPYTDYDQPLGADARTLDELQTAMQAGVDDVLGVLSPA